MSVRDFQERKKIERILFSLPILALCTALVVLAAWGVVRIGYRKYIIDREVAALRDEIAALEGQHPEKKGENKRVLFYPTPTPSNTTHK